MNDDAKKYILNLLKRDCLSKHSCLTNEASKMIEYLDILFDVGDIVKRNIKFKWGIAKLEIRDDESDDTYYDEKTLEDFVNFGKEL